MIKTRMSAKMHFSFTTKLNLVS